MDFHIIPDQEALQNCAWCEGHVSDDAEVVAFGAKLQPGIDLSDYQSHCIEITLITEQKDIYALVTSEDSEARNDGKDLMFMTCSDSCGIKLKEALEREVAAGNLLEQVLP